MIKKALKYISRLIFGSLTIWGGCLTYLNLIPDDYPCGTMQTCGTVIFSVITLFN